MKYLLFSIILFLMYIDVANSNQLKNLTELISTLVFQDNKTIPLQADGWALDMDNNKPELCLTDRNGHFFTLGESDFNSMSKQNHTIKELKKHIHYFQVTIP